MRARGRQSAARRRASARFGLVALGLGLAVPASARAAEYELNATTALQGYELTSPWGDVVIERRRFTQTLGAGAYHLQGDYAPGRADYAVVLRLRLDADMGMSSHLGDNSETTFATQRGAHFVPGLQEAPFDLMYGYVEGRNLLDGWLGFRVGRQYVTDMLGFWSFDGGLARITTPYWLQAELYGGFEQRGGLPLSSSRYERQGVWRGSHADFGGSNQPLATDYPSYQFAQPAPAFGAVLESAGPTFLHGRLSYRRVYNQGKSITQQFADPTGGYRTASGLRLSQERIGYAADATFRQYGGIKGGVAYDVYSQLVSSLYGGLEVHATPHLTLGADADYFEPTFDADSIWNWFTKSPITTLTGRASADVTEQLSISASGGVRMWLTEGDPDSFGLGECQAAAVTSPESCVGRVALDPTGPVADFSRSEANRESSSSTDVLGNVAGRYRWQSASLSLRGMLETGDRGHRGGGELAGDKRFEEGRYGLGARVSVYDWADPTRPSRDATSFAYVLAAGYRPSTVADVRFEWEHDMNRLVGQRYRVVALLDVKVLP